MPILNKCDAAYHNGAAVLKIYAGSTLVWPKSTASGVVFTEVDTSPILAHYMPYCINGVFSTVAHWSTDGVTWFAHGPGTSPSDQLGNLCFFNNAWISPTGYTSDGKSWVTIDAIWDDVSRVTGLFLYGGNVFATFGRRDLSRNLAAWGLETAFTILGNPVTEFTLAKWSANNPAGSVAVSILKSDHRLYYLSGGSYDWKLCVGTNEQIHAVIYEESLGKFVALSTQYAYSSTDGINWTRVSAPLPAVGIWTNLCWDGYKFAAMAKGSGANAVIFSPDGVDWTLTTKFINTGYVGIAGGNGRLICTGGNPQERIAVSPVVPPSS